VLQHEVPAVPDLVVEEPVAPWTAAMEDQCSGQLENAVARDAHPVREITVVLAHEVPLVEKADGHRGLAVEQKTVPGRHTDVGGGAAALFKRTVHPRVDRLAEEMQAAAGVLDRGRVAGMHHDGAAD